MIFTGKIAQSLKRTLDKIIDDPTDNAEKGSDYKVWCDESPMPDNWVDDLEMGGPGLLSRKPEGQEITTGSIDEGVRTRYIPDTYAMKLIVTEEAMEDSKYEKVLNLARRLKRACYKTLDINATLTLVNGFDTAFPGADGLPLWSASHTLPGGGTFSNLAAAPAAPSVSALVPIISQIKKMVGHDGIAEGYKPVRVLCPTEQWGDWSEIINSSFEPVTNNFATINVIKNDYGRMTVKDLKFWDNTTSNWAVQTDVDDQIQVKWRAKPRTRTWVDNGNENMLHSIRARWAVGYSDPRNSVGVNV
jgi:hypothetical protein